MLTRQKTKWEAKNLFIIFFLLLLRLDILRIGRHGKILTEKGATTRKSLGTPELMWFYRYNIVFFFFYRQSCKFFIYLYRKHNIVTKMNLGRIKDFNRYAYIACRGVLPPQELNPSTGLLSGQLVWTLSPPNMQDTPTCNINISIKIFDST